MPISTGQTLIPAAQAATCERIGAIMVDLSELFLNSMLTYGIWALGLATLVSAVGVPLPATMLLLAAGAFARQGMLSWQAALVLAALGAITGDIAGYLLVRSGSKLVLGHVEATGAWDRSKRVFDRWGGTAVFLSRFMLTPLALPMNLLAGSTRYAFRRYVGLVVAGEALWVVAFGGVGYFFADQWETMSSLLGSMTGAVAAVVAALAGAGYLLQRVRAAHGGVRPAGVALAA